MPRKKTVRVEFATAFWRDPCGTCLTPRYYHKINDYRSCNKYVDPSKLKGQARKHFEYRWDLNLKLKFNRAVSAVNLAGDLLSEIGDSSVHHVWRVEQRLRKLGPRGGDIIV